MLRHRIPVLVTLCCFLPVFASLAGSARVEVKVVDAEGVVVPEVLIVFQMIEDSEQQFTIDQNDSGAYAKTVQLAADDATWSVIKVLAPGFLPMKVDLQSLAADGTPVQDVTGMDLDPSNPIPPIKIVGSGKVKMDLTLGDQAVVMKRFRAVRAAAREAAKAEQAAAAPASSAAYAEAVRLYNAGEFEGSIAHFQEALNERPDDQELKLSYAGALYKAKRQEEFETVAQSVLEQNPKNPNLLMMVYSSSRGRGDMQKALGALLSVRELGGGKDLLPHLTFVAKKIGHKQAAVPALDAILELDPNNADAILGLANVHELAGRSQQAQGFIDRAVKQNPGGTYDLYFGLAKGLLGKAGAGPKEMDRAIVLLDKAVAANPDSVEALHRLGITRWQRGDNAGAKVALTKYLMLKPDADDRTKIADYLNSLQ